MKIGIIIGALLLVALVAYGVSTTMETDNMPPLPDSVVENEPMSEAGTADERGMSDHESGEASAATEDEDGAIGVSVAATSSVSSEADADTVATTAKVFDLTGSNYAFSESEIRVNEGDTVTIHFQSEGGFHDWVVDEFDAATEKVRAGEETTVTFVANATGSFEYYCSVGDHRARGMVGTLIVE